MPIAAETGREIQLKEGVFNFPPNFKCRVDVSALKELPRKFEICKQGIEALGDYFYEVQAEQKEGVSVQKAIWENMLERIQQVGVFNASSTYTNLANHLLPIRIALPQDRQHFPIDALLTSEPTNPFRETKKFARELLDITAAIKTLREEPLFQYKDFHLYPSRKSFIISESDTGERYLAVGIYCMAPDMEETASEEQSVKAIQDIVQERWDKGKFRKVLKASSLDSIFKALRHLSRDVPPLERFAIGSAYASVYTLAGFVVLWFLMLLSGITFNQPELDKMILQRIGPDGKAETLNPEIKPIRVVINTGEESENEYQVIGRYRASGRMEEFIGFLGFLDNWSRLNYEEELKISDFAVVRDETKDKVKGKLFTLEEKSDTRFAFNGLKLWGRQRFTIVPSDEKEEERDVESSEVAALDIEAIVDQGEKSKKSGKVDKYWQLTTTGEVNFERAAKQFIEQDLNIYAGPVKDGSTQADAVVCDRSFFSISFSSEIEQTPPPITIQYLAGDTEDAEVGSLTFDKFDLIKSKKLQVAINPTVETMYDFGLSQEPRKKTRKGSKQKGRKNRKQQKLLDEEEGTLADVYNFKGRDYYHLPEVPVDSNITNIKVKVETKMLPDKELTGKLHIAVPGITEPISIPIVFRPEQEVEFILSSSENSKLNAKLDEDGEIKKGEYNLQVTRSSDARGFVFPLQLQKGMWTSWNLLQPIEFGKLDFEIESRHRDPEVRQGVTVGLRRQLEPDTIYFYDRKIGKTRYFDEFSNSENIDAKPKVSDKDGGEPIQVKGKIKYFDLSVLKQEDKGKKDDFTTTQDKKRIRIRPEIAKACNQFYLVVLTEKNIEDTSLVVRWRESNNELLRLDISALSEKALRIVEYDNSTDEKGFSGYQLSQSISLKDKPLTVAGDRGKLRYRAIVFSGKEAYQEVSPDVYVHLSDPMLLNCLYQTYDGDWFTYMQQPFSRVKALRRPEKEGAEPAQVKLLKDAKDESTKKATDTISRTLKGASDKKSFDLEDFFCPDQAVIGKIKQYIFVPGPGVAPGDAEKNVDVTFYYPQRNMAETMTLKVSWPTQKQVRWDVQFTDTGFQASVYNYSQGDSARLAKKLRLLFTSAAVALLHEKYRSPNAEKEGKKTVDQYDMRWAQTIRWSLESVNPLLIKQGGESNYKQLPANTMGTLGEKLNKGMQAHDETAMKVAYKFMREIILLSWSPQTEAILAHELQLEDLEHYLKTGSVPKKVPFDLFIKREEPRDYPPLVDEPVRFDRVTLFIPYEKLMLESKPDLTYQLRESYYTGVPKNIAQAGEITGLLKDIYPYPDSFPKQEPQAGLEKAGVQVSNDLYQNLLRDSLWEARLNEINKGKSKFWIAMLALSPQISALTGEDIDRDEAGRIATLIQNKLSSYLLSPVAIQVVDWDDPNRMGPKIADKEGTVDVDIETNRDRLAAHEEQSGLTKFVERSMMPQFPKHKRCWYANFTFIIDRMTLDRCPFHKYVYLKTYRPLANGEPGPEIKVKLFKRGGDIISPYPTQNYKIEILKDPSGYTHFITVKGVPVYQDWFVPHICDVPGDVADNEIRDKRLRLKLYYDEGDTSKQVLRAGGYGPPMIDYEAHPAAMVLLEVTGYHISPDLIRELMRREFSTIVTKGDPTKDPIDWKWTFKIDNGPVVMPSAYFIDARKIVIPYRPYELKWKQTPEPDKGDRNLPSLAAGYKMDFVYVDIDKELPSEQFFPFERLKEMCDQYDQRMISNRRMSDLLEKFFQHSTEIEAVRSKFEWNQDLTDFYQEMRDPKKQMFTYTYSEGHDFVVKVPETNEFELPKGFDPSKAASHPQLLAPMQKKMAVIWRITPVSGAQRGFPKYIMEKRYFKYSEPVFSKD